MSYVLLVHIKIPKDTFGNQPDLEYA